MKILVELIRNRYEKRLVVVVTNTKKCSFHILKTKKVKEEPLSPMHFQLGRLCRKPPDPYTIGKLRLSSLSVDMIILVG